MYNILTKETFHRKYVSKLYREICSSDVQNKMCHR
jgi:hypothetical protein